MAASALGRLASGLTCMALAVLSPPHSFGATSLEGLAAAKFGRLTRAESLMLRAVPQGDIAWGDAGPDERDPANDPSKAAQWQHARTIRADLIRWLYVDPGALGMVALTGVRVGGARVEGKLDLSRIKMDLPLELHNCAIPGGVDLSNADVRLIDFRGSWTGPISGNSLVVRGDLLLRRGFHSDGAIDLTGARIQGTLSLNNATVLSQRDLSVVLASATIGGDALFIDFHTNKLVVASLTTIGGNLAFIRAEFKGGRPYTSGLEAINTRVRGALAWTQIGPKPSDVRLDLTFARVGALADEAASWPTFVFMNEFVYDKFDEVDETPKDLPSRLTWLAKQPEFRPQPYLQLAKILAGVGRADDATTVLILKERRQREEAARAGQWPVPLFKRGWSWFLRWTIGYGYLPMRAIGWSAVIVVFGWIIFWRGYRAALIVPSEKDACVSFIETGTLPLHYQPFSSFVYSLETFLPFVDLRQGKHWFPTGRSGRGHRLFAGCLLWYLRFHILSGWLLSTLFVAGFTGLIHRG